jgi:hypothetical protein
MLHNLHVPQSAGQPAIEVTCCSVHPHTGTMPALYGTPHDTKGGFRLLMYTVPAVTAQWLLYVPPALTRNFYNGVYCKNSCYQDIQICSQLKSHPSATTVQSDVSIASNCDGEEIDCVYIKTGLTKKYIWTDMCVCVCVCVYTDRYRCIHRQVHVHIDRYMYVCMYIFGSHLTANTL